jgi:DNA invertase Pin-like site-specific DNA recombinase
MTIGIYIRVSTEEQAREGYSIPAQKERLTAYCNALGWEDFKFYVDEGVSAKDTNRPKLQLLLDHVKAGSISTILVYRLDRFTRRVKDLHKMLELLEKHQCAFKSATEPYDTSTAMGKLFITIVAALAEWETDNLSERVKMALEEKVVQSGERVGNIPYGFDLSEEEKLVKNKKQAPVVLYMIDKFKSGMSANALCNFLNKTNNDRVWHPNGILRILKNPALYGATRWNDKVIENTHDGFITKQDFFKIQRMLEDRSLHHNRDVQSIYLFQGVLICPHCKKILTVNRFIRKKKDGSKNVTVTYKCQSCYKAGNTMETIGEYRFLEALYEYMKHVEIKNLEPIEIKDEHAILLEQLDTIEKKRSRYQKAWAMGPEFMTDEEFEKLMMETKPIYDELKKKLTEYNAPVQIDTEALKKIVFMFNKDFMSLTQEEKRSFVSQFIRKIEFKLIKQPPKDKRNKKGKSLIIITNVEFY